MERVTAESLHRKARRMDNAADVERWGLGPVCDRCKTPLALHATTLAGTGCDLGAAWDQLVRPITEGLARLADAFADAVKRLGDALGAVEASVDELEHGKRAHSLGRDGSWTKFSQPKRGRRGR